MKKTFITLTIAVGTFAFGQVGVNTTEPKSTLDVMGVLSPTVPDGILIPRYSVTELAAKDAAYGASQNGVMVFITTGVGTTGKTSEITGAGFYYYNDPTSKWKGIAGSTTPTPSFVATDEKTQSYVVQPTDDFIRLNITTPNQILTLPTTGVTPGKIVYVSNIGGTSLTVSPIPRNTFRGAVIEDKNSAAYIYLGGTGDGSWDRISGY
ncbi:hypothetical protein [Chryseobacterium fistulae]|uniref:Uncharacterized protein n=1 Tax=Chryseobacterium fistulae TaxID=2675058 RepID=A0A6N4XXU0_9FLAO|nr:hypothetical protein [Chryseobacterium fistulae]CAA7391353.1 hypothetical protein CHRY9393_02891 [Chryseobacterium fistulae]